MHFDPDQHTSTYLWVGGSKSTSKYFKVAFMIGQKSFRFAMQNC